jgi:hypothetical protein
MTPEHSQARSKVIEEHLAPLRSRIDQLSKTIEDEDINPTRETTDQLVEILGELHDLEDHARTTKNTRTIGAVTKERDRVRAALGFTPRRRRR